LDIESDWARLRVLIVREVGIIAAQPAANFEDRLTLLDEATSRVWFVKNVVAALYHMRVSEGFIS
jgi:hypothetical protein